ncbi:MAG TPA: MopE-related protein, partial [Sandaracinaceae bacterium LLY-WYZ-13_1]|nr:MopE-related protein [Sandaracinaceae bacterium LLY-WYZ-13_1]
MRRIHRLRPLVALLALPLAGCLGHPEDAGFDDVGKGQSLLTASERRMRAAQIRDAARANGIEQGWLLAGIADAETRMSHCWSELTWACMGPNSPDCGGGPVVAGAGDGPCSLREGGLGMFQFDAGTFEDTLAREGDRVLSIAGNVAAAVDFVVRMVIRSAYVPGVDTRAQAIDWINGVRIDNGRWDAWIRTVTHYYNGCAPSYSCFSSRYAHYRDNTTGVFHEMGADFWAVANDYAAEYVSQTFPLAREPFELYPGEERTGAIELRNTGEATWEPGATNLGTTEPRDGASPLEGPDWIGPNRPATVDRTVPPGETGRFEFTVRAPDAPGDYPQFFTLVQEGTAWFSDQGGPPDDQLQVRVTVVEPPPCPAGTGEAWTCAGDARERCRWGEVEREPCADGCTPRPDGDDVCADGADDADGDGAPAPMDCADDDPTRYPGAPEVCEDGVDQDCDGRDPSCVPGADGAVVGPDGGVGSGGALTGGC